MKLFTLVGNRFCVKMPLEHQATNDKQVGTWGGGRGITNTKVLLLLNQKSATTYYFNLCLQFPLGINREQALARPILYSNWLSKDYVPVQRDQLREYVKARLKVFFLFNHCNLEIKKFFENKNGFLHYFFSMIFRCSMKKNWMYHWFCSMKCWNTC